MDNVDQLLNKLTTAFLTHQEVEDLTQQVRALQRDAERYRWLTLYTSKLFMSTEQGLDEQMDKAMGRGK